MTVGGFVKLTDAECMRGIFMLTENIEPHAKMESG